ncbi:MAG: hypothetical protein MJ198_07295 [Bacteroidales bacterium]|nr:hypothetical protein [Bacteroidales bacterium]
MKRVLILAYDFPPYVSVGGLRPYAWYKYFKNYGIYPIVVTRQWENKYGNELDYIAPSATNKTIVEETEYGTIIRTPYKPNLANKILLKYGKNKYSFLRKAISAFYDSAQYILNIGPKSGIYQGAKEFLQHNSVDYIIATGEPFVLFKYASELSKKHNIPWIADYRDPWTQDPDRSRNKFFLLRNSFFEKRYTKNALFVTTVNDYFVSKIQSLVQKKIFVIANGYDPEAIKAIKDIPQQSDKLRFAYVGTIYKYHPLDSVLDCFNQAVLNKQLDNFEFNFYGIRDHIGIKKLLNEKYQSLQPFIHIHPQLKNKELLQELAKHNILVLFNYYSIVGTKIYDYIALQRHILFCYDNDKEALQLKQKYLGNEECTANPQKEIIQITKAGTIVRDKQHLIELLPQIHKEFQQGGIKCSTTNQDNFSRETQVKILSTIITTLHN